MAEFKAQDSTFSDGNKFFILDYFDTSLNREIVLPLTEKIEELADKYMEEM